MIRNVFNPLGSVRAAFAVAVGIPLLLVATAFAQDPGATPDAGGPPAGSTGSSIPDPNAGAGASAEVERVVVTGSNIPTAEEVGPNPVDTYRKEDIQRLGVRTSSDLVRKLPAATGSQITENNTNGGDGSAEINLRGILPKETLVLQDNRRVAPIGFAGDTVDLNMFPVGLIDHVDILKDGASAIYGSDAVAGVFNVFLIKRFRGLEVYASYGNHNLGFAGDAAEQRAYILAGTGDDKTEIVVYAEVYNKAAIFSKDADISSDPRNFPEYGGVNTRSGNLAGRVQSHQFYPQLNGGRRTPTPHSAANENTSFEYVPRSGAPPTPGFPASPFSPNERRERNFFNFAALTPAIAARDNEYLYGAVTRDICDKYLTVFADFKYTRTFWDGALAPAPFLPEMWTDAAHPFGISGAAGFSVPTQNAFNPFTTPDYVSAGGFDPDFPQTQVSAAPAGTGFTTGVRYRGLEAGLRTDKITAQNYMFTGGLRGNLGQFGDYLKNWNWETGFRYNEDYRVERFGGIVNNNALRAALLDTNPDTAFNPFGINQNRPNVIRSVFVTTNHIGVTTLELEDAKVYGDLFNIPAGPVSFAIGGEHRREHTQDNPDALTASGQTTGATNFAPTRGSRDVWSAYWEVKLPVTSPTWNFPGMYSLEFNYQERYDQFSDFGSTQRPKISARWQPIDAAWTIRATYNEAFHAPSLAELFSGNSQSFPAIVDPKGLTTEKQIETIFSGFPGLQPETAYEWTYGMVVTPGKWWSALQGLTVSGDFFHIDLRAVTVALDPQQIVNNEEQFPGLVTRDPVGGGLLQIRSPLRNLGRLITEGYDYELSYLLETTRFGAGDFGNLLWTLNGTYTDRLVIQLEPNGPEEVVVGKWGAGFFGPSGGGSATHNRFYVSMFYTGPQGSWLGGIDTGFTVSYIGQYWDDKPSTAAVEFVDINGTAPGGFVPRFDDRKIREIITADFLANYTFNMPAPVAATDVAGLAKDGGKNVAMKDGKDKNVMPVSTAEYNPCGWRAMLDKTTLSLGINNISDELPPFVAGAFENGYDQQTASIKGRFWYFAVKKRF